MHVSEQASLSLPRLALALEFSTRTGAEVATVADVQAFVPLWDHTSCSITTSSTRAKYVGNFRLNHELDDLCFVLLEISSIFCEIRMTRTWFAGD